MGLKFGRLPAIEVCLSNAKYGLSYTEAIIKNRKIFSRLGRELGEARGEYSIATWVERIEA